MLELGKKAPDFELPDQNGEMHKLSDYAGKKVILYFYPKEHFIKFRNMGQATLQELYQICEEQGVKLRSVEDLNDREHGVRFDDFLCMDAFRMGIKSKDDLRRYSLEELEEMCPKGIRLFVRLKKLKTIQE